MGLWLWRVNIPSTHWCFFLADLDGASQVKGPVMSIKNGLRSLKPYLYVDNRSLYLRCKTRERHDRRLTSRASNGLRMDIKLKILSYRKSPGRQKTAKRSPASSDRHSWRYCLVFRRRRLSHASPQGRDTQTKI